MNNILFVIYHPSELSNWITKLAPFMKDSHITVFHIGKLHGIDVANIEGLNLIDISAMSYKDIEKCLVRVNPSLSVFMSFRSLIELTLQRLCQDKHIRQVYLEHGIFSNDTLRFRSNKLRKERGIVIRRQIKFISLAAQRILNSTSMLHELILFYKIYLKGQFQLSKHDTYLLYSRRSFESISSVFQITEKVVEYVGYPIFNGNMDKIEGDRICKSNEGVIYVHQPLISDGIAQISYEEEKKFILYLSKTFRLYGKFTILLHPRANLKEYNERYKNTEVKVIQSPNNYKLFANAALVIGHYSTALLYALYFNKPTLVLDYPSTQNEKSFNQMFTYIKDVKMLKHVEGFKTQVHDKTYVMGDHNTFEHIANRLEIYAN